MAQEIKYTCKHCDFSFTKTEGAGRLTSFTTYFCYDCLKSSPHCELNQAGVELQGKVKEPTFFKYFFDKFKTLNGEQREKEHQSARAEFEIIRRDFFEQVEKGMLDLYTPPTPQCEHCKTKEVIEFHGEFCPLCASQKLKKEKLLIID
ncbi:MAG: hypothetical protein CME62_05935 [Halobacteriovoraceae bacterium]|nr:hypothetical protein [Halobacteriovoraceae bacterium]|tara:strand:- start:1356 stop:1799 length:444 start_codon:yes stop_codon:yes gene_type:complete